MTKYCAGCNNTGFVQKNNLDGSNSFIQCGCQDYGTLSTNHTKSFQDEILLLKSKLQIAVDALERNVEGMGNFIDRLSLEGIANPDLSTARLGTIESLHCFKRSIEALQKIKELDGK